jgi:hypothetical protein
MSIYEHDDEAEELLAAIADDALRGKLEKRLQSIEGQGYSGDTCHQRQRKKHVCGRFSPSPE